MNSSSSGACCVHMVLVRLGFKNSDICGKLGLAVKTGRNEVHSFALVQRGKTLPFLCSTISYTKYLMYKFRAKSTWPCSCPVFQDFHNSLEGTLHKFLISVAKSWVQGKVHPSILLPVTPIFSSTLKGHKWKRLVGEEYLNQRVTFLARSKWSWKWAVDIVSPYNVKLSLTVAVIPLLVRMKNYCSDSVHWITLKLPQLCFNQICKYFGKANTYFLASYSLPNIETY